MGGRTAGQIMSLNFNIYSVGAGGAGAALIGRAGAVRRLFGIMSSPSDCNAPVPSSGPQYQAKTKPIYCLGRRAVAELIFNAEMNRANTSHSNTKIKLKFYKK